jgi:Fur family zinc uptake transcriptional regulator
MASAANAPAPLLPVAPGSAYINGVAQASRSIRAQEAVKHAVNLCERKGVRLTALRERALTALADAGRPVKAYDLLPVLGEKNAPAKPATAYRALEFLEQLGLVHKVAGINAFVLCSHGGGAHVTTLYVCEKCGGADERAEHAAPGGEAPRGFHIERSVVEHYGVCAACAA